MTDYDSIYQIKRTISMAQRLVNKDAEFKSYVGASPRISQTIALLDTMMQLKEDDETKKKLQFFKNMLIRKNKALFASVVSELSKLSFYLGIDDASIDAT